MLVGGGALQGEGKGGGEDVEILREGEPHEGTLKDENPVLQHRTWG